MQVACPRCAREVPFEDVNVTAMTARCTACREVFAFGDAQATPAGEDAPGAAIRAVPPRPDRVTVEGAIDETPIPADYRSYGARRATPLTLRWRWFTPAGLFLLFFAVVWCSFLVNFYRALAGGDAPLFAWIFPLGHVAVGVVVAKAALANLLNHTAIRVDAEKLIATSGPVRWPWQRPVVVPVAELRQLSILEKKGNKGSLSYGVVAHLEDGTSRTLVDGLHDSHVATFVERAVEQHLGLPDEPWRNHQV
jgi:hypothetical protein